MSDPVSTTTPVAAPLDATTPPPDPPPPTIGDLRNDVSAIDTTFAALQEAEVRLERQAEELTNMRANIATYQATYDATVAEVTTKLAAYTDALNNAAARRSIALPQVGATAATT